MLRSFLRSPMAEVLAEGLAAASLMRSDEPQTGPGRKSILRPPKSSNVPHQGNRERARRMRQMAKARTAGEP